MNQYIAAIDQGTTSSRCMIFDHDGAVVSVAQKEHEQIFPRAGWVEHDPVAQHGRGDGFDILETGVRPLLHQRAGLGSGGKRERRPRAGSVPDAA